MVELPVKGATVTTVGRSEAVATPDCAVIHSATQPGTMRGSADVEAIAVNLDHSAVELELSRMLRRDIDAPIVFGPSMSLSAPPAGDWGGTVGFVLDEICQGIGSLDHPLVRTRVEQLLIDQLLLTQTHDFTGQLETGYRPARPPAVRRAIEIIRARAANPLTVPMLAELTGVSVRGLQQ